MAFDGLLEQVAAEHPLPMSYSLCISFMLDGLRLLEPMLPDVGRHALAVATQYWTRGNKTVSLAVEKSAVWAELDRDARAGVVAASDEARLRSVLFVLDTKPATNDVLELLDWFIQFMRQGGAQDADLLALLKAKFSLS